MRIRKDGMYATVPADIGAVLVAHKGWVTDDSVPVVTLPTGSGGSSGTMTPTELDTLIRAIVDAESAQLRAVVDAENVQLKDDLAKKADKTALSATVLNIQSATDKTNTLQTSVNASLTRITTLEGKALTVADTPWTACTMSGGISGILWARVWKGKVVFKAASTAAANPAGLLTGRITSTSSFTTIATLPGSIPKLNGNSADWYCPISTYQQGSQVPYGTGQMVIYGNGSIGVLAGNVPMDGFYPHSIAGYAVGAWT